jgi:hypothetical protein
MKKGKFMIVVLFVRYVCVISDFVWEMSADWGTGVEYAYGGEEKQ